MHCMNCGQKITSENIEICVACGRNTGHLTPKSMREKVVSQEKAMQQEKERIQDEMLEHLTDSTGDWEKKMEYIYEPMDVLDGIISDYTNKITNEYNTYEPTYLVDDTILNSLDETESTQIFPKNDKIEIEDINNSNNVVNSYQNNDVPSTIIVKNENVPPPEQPKRPVNDIPHLYVVSAEVEEDSSEPTIVQEQFKPAKEAVAERVEAIQASQETPVKPTNHEDNDVKEYTLNTNKQTFSQPMQGFPKHWQVPPQTQPTQPTQNQVPPLQGQPTQNQVPPRQGQPTQNQVPQWQGQSTQNQVPQWQGQSTQNQTPQWQGQPTQNQVPPLQGQPTQNQTLPMQGQPTQNQVPPMQGQPTQNQVPPMQGQPTQNQVPQWQGQPTQNQTPQWQGQPTQNQTPQWQGQPTQNQTPQWQGQPTQNQTPPRQGQPTQNQTPQWQGQPTQNQTPQWQGQPTQNQVPQWQGQPMQNQTPQWQVPPTQNQTPQWQVPPTQNQVPTRQMPPNQNQTLPNNGKIKPVHPSQLPQPQNNKSQLPQIIDETVTKGENSVKVFLLSFVSFSMLFAICIGIFMLIPRDFKIENGILVEYTGRDTVVQIPNKVDKIGDGVFENLSFIEEIIIPETVTSIGNQAFANCTSLKSVEFPETIVHFGDDAVAGVPLFAGYTFEGSRLVEYTGNETNVVIPNFVTTIVTQAFFNNDIVQTITLPSGLRSIEEVAFSSCDALETVVIPNGTTTILNSAFSGCDNLRNISIPDSVEFIGSDAFAGTPWYNNLSEEFNIYGNNILIKYVGNSSEVTIPENVTLIGNAAFRNNETIKSVTIPSRTKEIGYQAFSGCDALETVVMKEGVTTISEGAFLGCFSLKNIEFPTSIMSVKRMSLRTTNWYQNFYDKFGIIGESTLVRYMGDEVVFEIPDQVKHITDEAFASNILIEAIVIPNTVVYIDDNAFAELTVLEKIYCVENSYVDKYFKENESLSYVTLVYP